MFNLARLAVLGRAKTVPSHFASSRSFSTSKFNRTLFREPATDKPRLVLAYSGGLDTSCQLSYLTKELGFEVAAYIADLGQDDLRSQEQVDDVRKKADASGAYAFYCEDLKSSFIQEYVYPMISSSALYEGRYLFGTSIARPCIAKRQVEIAQAEKATHISHGSTGKGNDQVRFELAYLCLDPSLQPITLWRDPEYCSKFQGRADLMKYAVEQGLTQLAQAKTKSWSYSEDENCLHVSYESGELEDAMYPVSEYKSGSKGIEYPGEVLRKKRVEIKDTPDDAEVLKINFKEGIPTSVENLTDGKKVNDPVDLFFYLNKVAGRHGVGRIDIVENRFVGMKSRGCYETPAGTVLFSAHRDLETLTMDREVMRVRDSLHVTYADKLYNGFWFSPEMDYLKNIMKESQAPVTGSAYVELIKGNVFNVGRESEHSLYSEKLASMDSHGEYDPTQATGFIKTLATRLRAAKLRDSAMGNDW